MWEILQEKVYQTGITDLELSTMPLTNGCRNNDMIQLAHSVLSRYFSLFRSVMSILYTFSCNTRTLCNQLDSNRANLEATDDLG